MVLLPYPQEDADEPAGPPSSSSKLSQLLLASKAWLLGEGRPKVDPEDIREARGVTAFAKETLMPAMYEVRPQHFTGAASCVASCHACARNVLLW